MNAAQRAAAIRDYSAWIGEAERWRAQTSDLPFLLRNAAHLAALRAERQRLIRLLVVDGGATLVES